MSKKETEIEQIRDNFYSAADVKTLALQQGVGPLDFAKVRQLGRFWPEDDSIDDILSTVRRWRDEEGDESDRELT